MLDCLSEGPRRPNHYDFAAALPPGVIIAARICGIGKLIDVDRPWSAGSDDLGKVLVIIGMAAPDI